VLGIAIKEVATEEAGIVVGEVAPAVRTAGVVELVVQGLSVGEAGSAEGLLPSDRTGLLFHSC